MKALLQVCCLLAAAAPALGGDAGAGPFPLIPGRAEIPGLVEGGVRTVDITLINTGRDSLRNVAAASTCRYVDAAIDRQEIAPGGSAVLRVAIDTRGNLGRIRKVIEITTDRSRAPYEFLLTGVIEHRSFSRENAATVLAEPCRACHLAGDVRAETGERLYDRACFSCHREASRLSGRDGDNLRQIIERGRPGTMMPAYVTDAGGPLSAAQIGTLVRFILSSPAARAP